MFAAIILIALIVASPMAIFIDGNIAIGIEASIMALATVLVAHKSAPAETGLLPKLPRLAFLLATVPALWMVIQVLPLGYAHVANPVWENTQQALGHAVVGSIGIDTGAGLFGLIQYITALAILLVTMAVTLNRSRADGVLFALLLASTISCLPIAGLFSRLGIISDKLPDAGTVRNIGLFGVLLAFTVAIRAFERRQSSRAFSKSKLALSLVASFVSLAICGSALVVHWTSNLGLGLAFALAVLLTIAFIRRFEIGIWGAAAIAAIVLSVSVSVLWIRYAGRPLDLMTSFSDDDALVAITKRILADAPWVGSGPGSFEILANVYQQPGDPVRVTTASTAAAKIAIELGRPMLWIAAAPILFATAVSLRGSLRRGRDSFYPALGAGCLIALLIRAFADASIFAPSVSIIAAASAGLALAQSSGKTAK